MPTTSAAGSDLLGLRLGAPLLVDAGNGDREVGTPDHACAVDLVRLCEGLGAAADAAAAAVVTLPEDLAAI